MIERDPNCIAFGISVLRPHELTIAVRVGGFHSHNVGRYSSRSEALKDFPRVKREQLAARKCATKPQQAINHV